MAIRTISILVSISMALGGVAVSAVPASASETLPTFTISQNQLTVTGAGSLSVGGATKLRLAACKATGSVPAPITTLTSENTLFGLDCTRLVNTNSLNDGVDFTDLSNGAVVNLATAAELSTNRPLIQLLGDYPNIALVLQLDGNPSYDGIRTAGVSYQPFVGTPTMPQLTLSGTAITFTPGSFSENLDVSNFVVACTSERLQDVTTHVPTPQLTTGCRPLYANSSLTDFTPATDLSTALIPDAGARIAYVAATHGSHLTAFTFSAGRGVALATIDVSGVQLSTPVVVAPPYTGPVVNAPAGLTARPGSSVVLDGNRLSGVSKAEIAGIDAQVSVLADGQISIVVPSGLPAGTYDLVITSDSGRLTVQGAIVVRGPAVSGSEAGAAGEARPSTRRLDDSSVKVWVFEAFGVGKVQILLNGEEVAWVRATDASDPKLRDGRLVRTLTLEPGRNVVQVLVNGEQVRRTVYSTAG